MLAREGARSVFRGIWCFAWSQAALILCCASGSQPGTVTAASLLFSCRGSSARGVRDRCITAASRRGKPKWSGSARGAIPALGPPGEEQSRTAAARRPPMQAMGSQLCLGAWLCTPRAAGVPVPQGLVVSLCTLFFPGKGTGNASHRSPAIQVEGTRGIYIFISCRLLIWKSSTLLS